MLDFVLCDDNFNVLNKLEKTLETIFIDKNFDARIVLSTTTPEELINFMKHIVHLKLLCNSCLNNLCNVINPIL